MPEIRERNIYGRRSGRPLKDNQKKLLKNLLPEIAIKLPDQGKQLRPASLFETPFEQFWLEIGIGSGEHLAERAKNNPGVGFLGAEYFLNGVAKTLDRINQNGSENVRLLHGDGRILLDFLADNSLDRTFILFPDPWPKKRHHFRRIINAETLDALARIMKPGSELLIATDHVDYLTWIMRHCQQHTKFNWQARKRSDWLRQPEGWTTTRYEKKAITEGRIPTFLSYKVI